MRASAEDALDCWRAPEFNSGARTIFHQLLIIFLVMIAAIGSLPLSPLRWALQSESQGGKPGNPVQIFGNFSFFWI